MTAIFREEDLAEGGAKVRVEDGVDDRVEEAVEVAEPRDDADEQRRVVASVGAERPHERQYEERKPADDERPGDDGQRPRCLAFPRLRSLPSLRLGRRRLGAAESRQLEVEPRQVESTAARRRGHGRLIDRQHARPAAELALVARASAVPLIRYTHQTRTPAYVISRTCVAFLPQR